MEVERCCELHTPVGVARRRPDDEFIGRLLEATDFLRGRASMLAGDSALSEDFVQTTFERALRAQQRPAAREIQPWLMRILKNVAIDHWRSAAVRQSCALDPERIAAPSGDTTPWWRELDASELAEAARQLPETFRRVFLLRLDGRSNLEVARQLQLNATTVATRLFRARRLMQRALAASRRAQDPR